MSKFKSYGSKLVGLATKAPAFNVYRTYHTTHMVVFKAVYKSVKKGLAVRKHLEKFVKRMKDYTKNSTATAKAALEVPQDPLHFMENWEDPSNPREYELYLRAYQKSVAALRKSCRASVEAGNQLIEEYGKLEGVVDTLKGNKSIDKIVYLKIQEDLQWFKLKNSTAPVEKARDRAQRALRHLSVCHKNITDILS